MYQHNYIEFSSSTTEDVRKKKHFSVQELYIRIYFTMKRIKHSSYTLFVPFSCAFFDKHKKIQIMNCQQVTQKITGAYLMTRARAFSSFSMEISVLYFCSIWDEMRLRRMCTLCVQNWPRSVLLVCFYEAEKKHTQCWREIRKKRNSTRNK